MARQRKGQPHSVPLPKSTDTSETKTQKPLIEISEEEQWRLINRSGVLKIPRSEQRVESSSIIGGDGENITLGEELLNAMLYVIPFSFLLMMMEILIHYQYNKKPTLDILLDRMISGVPIMAIFVFYTLRYKLYRVSQILLFATSILSGCRLIYQINNANWLTNIKECPPLATIWIYSVFMADLGPAVLSLLTVTSFVWWKELKIIL